MIKDTQYKFRQVQGPCKIKSEQQSHVIVNTKDLKVVEVFEQIRTRKIMRQRAKIAMVKQGRRRICSNPKKNGSYFASNWKEAVNYG